ncbi:MAG: DUF3000 family protein [Actinomycetales bacterium]|nr:DUF3000 family protein [Actinomycetales bacterium]
MRSIVTGTDAFERALERVKSVRPRPEFVLDEAPAPQRLAPSAMALTAEMSDPDSEEASGRLVLLHDPDGVEEWNGSFRVVVFVRGLLESESTDDPLLHDVAWTWVTEALEANGCHPTQLGGTVTRTAGRSFGTMLERPADGFVEIRASWTPREDPTTGEPLDDLAGHVEAWLDLLAQAAGLPPVPRGVAQVDVRRRRGRP